MRNLPYRLPVLGILLLLAGLFCWWIFGADPREVFTGEVNDMIEQANQGEHSALRKKLSPEAESYISDNFMPVPQALYTAHKLDAEQKIRYRLVQVSVFQPRDYAEIEVERSGPGGNFSKARPFPVPFVYRDGGWLVAGAFRSERGFRNPYK